MRAGAATLGPLLFDSLEQSAHNVVEACRHHDWDTPVYWGKPGKFERRTPIMLDSAVTQQLMEISHRLTGA